MITQETQIELTKKLRDELKESNISDSISSLNFKALSPEDCYDYLLFALPDSARTNSGVLRQKYLKRYAHLEHGGWWCRTLDISGQDSLWGCLKPYKPYTYEEYKGKTKAIKYETPPNADLKPYYLRVDRDSWEKVCINNNVSERKIPKFADITEEAIAQEFWEWVKSTKSVPIVITEGAKKTASLLSAGFCAVGLSGINGAYRNPRDEDGKPLGDPFLVPEIEAIAQKNREIVLCFDNDRKAKTLRNVEIAIARTAKLLRAKGCKVKIMTWAEDHPGIKGVDDLHYEQGEHELWQVFDQRVAERSWKRVVADIQKELATPSNPKGEVEAITSTELAPRVSYLDAVDAEKSETKDGIVEPEPELTFQEIALREIYADGHYISLHDDLYKFNGRHYELLYPAMEKRRIIGWASNYAVYDPRSRKRVYRYMNSKSVNNIWSWVLDRFAINPDRVNPSGLNLANGVLKIKWQGNKPTWKLHPHTPKEYFLYCSDVHYQPEADPGPCNKLLECLDPAPRVALLRILAASFDLQKIRQLHSRGIKAVIAKGAGSNGKDSIRAAIAKLFSGQLTSLGFTEFYTYDKGKKFSLYPLETATINWSSENNQGTPLDKTESLNIAITGEENGLWIE